MTEERQKELMNAEEEQFGMYLGFIQIKHERARGLKQLHLNESVRRSGFHLKSVVVAENKSQTRRVTSDEKHIETC